MESSARGSAAARRGRGGPRARADPELTLARLRSVGRLPKRLGWEKNELDCSYPLDGIGKVSESEGLLITAETVEVVRSRAGRVIGA